LIIAAGVPRQSRSQISTGFDAHHNAFFADDLGAGLFELYAKAPIEKRQKSQEVDTESLCFLPFVKSKNTRKNEIHIKRIRCSNKRIYRSIVHHHTEGYHRQMAVGKPIILL
jgi:hypothetical protein